MNVIQRNFYGNRKQSIREVFDPSLIVNINIDVSFRIPYSEISTLYVVHDLLDW